jgi:hypothetical protein
MSDFTSTLLFLVAATAFFFIGKLFFSIDETGLEERDE